MGCMSFQVIVNCSSFNTVFSCAFRKTKNKKRVACFSRFSTFNVDYGKCFQFAGAWEHFWWYRPQPQMALQREADSRPAAKSELKLDLRADWKPWLIFLTCHLSFSHGFSSHWRSVDEFWTDHTTNEAFHWDEWTRRSYFGCSSPTPRQYRKTPFRLGSDGTVGKEQFERRIMMCCMMVMTNMIDTMLGRRCCQALHVTQVFSALFTAPGCTVDMCTRGWSCWQVRIWYCNML